MSREATTPAGWSSGFVAALFPLRRRKSDVSLAGGLTPCGGTVFCFCFVCFGLFLLISNVLLVCLFWFVCFPCVLQIVSLSCWCEETASFFLARLAGSIHSSTGLLWVQPDSSSPWELSNENNCVQPVDTSQRDTHTRVSIARVSSLSAPRRQELLEQPPLNSGDQMKSSEVLKFVLWLGFKKTVLFGGIWWSKVFRTACLVMARSSTVKKTAYDQYYMTILSDRVVVLWTCEK